MDIREARQLHSQSSEIRPSKLMSFRAVQIMLIMTIQAAGAAIRRHCANP